MSNKSVYRLALALFVAAAAKAGQTGTVSGMNRFAVASYQELAKGQGNLVISPFNIASSLSMALAGARGETAAEMAKVLNEEYPDAVYNAALAALQRDLVKM